MEEKYFPDEPDYEYWLICPKCKKSIPIINLFIVKEKEVVNDSSGIVKDVDTLYADIKCKNCEPMSIPLKTYFEFIKKNFKMMKPEKIDIKFKNKDFEEGDEKIIYCMDQHGYLDYKHYLMHNVVKFKFNHILCEKELNIDSYCGLNEKHDYYKKGKYFCQLCNLPLCNACYEHHKTNFKAHPISKLENENSLVEKIYNKFIEIQLRDEYKNLEINKLILEYISLLKKNFDRIAVNHIPNYYLLQNFKLLQIRENEGEYLINSNEF